MADYIAEKFRSIQNEPRKKCLVIMNYRHAFGPTRYASGRLATNVGAFLYGAFPGRTANVLLVPLMPFLNAPVQGGAWEAAFRETGNRPVGFNFAGSPFGHDWFDLFYFSPWMAYHYRYEDVFTGYVFDRPLDEQFLETGIPGLMKGYEDVLLQRANKIDDANVQEARELIRTSPARVQEQMWHKPTQTRAESGLMSIAAVGFLIALAAFARRETARQKR